MRQFAASGGSGGRAGQAIPRQFKLVSLWNHIRIFGLPAFARDSRAQRRKGTEGGRSDANKRCGERTTGHRQHRTHRIALQVCNPVVVCPSTSTPTHHLPDLAGYKQSLQLAPPKARVREKSSRVEVRCGRPDGGRGEGLQGDKDRTDRTDGGVHAERRRDT